MHNWESHNFNNASQEYLWANQIICDTFWHLNDLPVWHFYFVRLWSVKWHKNYLIKALISSGTSLFCLPKHLNKSLKIKKCHATPFGSFLTPTPLVTFYFDMIKTMKWHQSLFLLSNNTCDTLSFIFQSVTYVLNGPFSVLFQWNHIWLANWVALGVVSLVPCPELLQHSVPLPHLHLDQQQHHLHHHHHLTGLLLLLLHLILKYSFSSLPPKERLCQVSSVTTITTTGCIIMEEVIDHFDQYRNVLFNIYSFDEQQKVNY